MGFSNRFPVAVCLAVLLLFCAPAPAHSDVITIATDSALQFAIDELIEQYESASTYTARPVIGSTTALTERIIDGAVFDILITADLESPSMLKQRRLAAGPVIHFADGGLSIWSFRNDAVIDGPSVLTLDGFPRIGIVAPERSAYGRAAMEALDTYNLNDIVSARLIPADDTMQSVAMLMNGSTDAVIIARSIVESPKVAGTGFRFDLPNTAFSPIRHGAVRLTASPAENRIAVRTFLDYLESPAVRSILSRHGFTVTTKERP